LNRALKLKYEELLSNFGFKFNLSRYIKWNNSMCASSMEECCLIAPVDGWQCPVPSNADVITVMIGERRQGLTLRPVSAQLELFRAPYDPA
jgi:hypothetical protein